jgi:hypothetical protein
MMAVVRECDDTCIVSCALAVLIESQGDTRAVVAELKELFAKRLPEAENEWAMYYLANAIAKMGGEEDADALIPMLGHPGSIVRGNGILLLSEFGGADTLAALERTKAWVSSGTERDAIDETISAIEKRLKEQAEGGD